MDIEYNCSKDNYSKRENEEEMSIQTALMWRVPPAPLDQDRIQCREYESGKNRYSQEEISRLERFGFDVECEPVRSKFPWVSYRYDSEKCTAALRWALSLFKERLPLLCSNPQLQKIFPNCHSDLLEGASDRDIRLLLQVLVGGVRGVLDKFSYSGDAATFLGCSPLTIVSTPDLFLDFIRRFSISIFEQELRLIPAWALPIDDRVGLVVSELNRLQDAGMREAILSRAGTRIENMRKALCCRVLKALPHISWEADLLWCSERIHAIGRSLICGPCVGSVE